MPIITLDVQTDYPNQFQRGTTLHSSSGFIIGTVTDSVVDYSGEDEPRTVQTQVVSRETLREIINPGDL